MTEPEPMPDLFSAFDTVPFAAEPAGGLAGLREAARACRACPLWEPATQTVFGEGPADARIMLVGEQPGDKEDIAGLPFVGPAGHKLDVALAEAGLNRRTLYVTNAVKHFKFTPRGKFRLHQKPVTSEIRACGPWLTREIETVRPALVVALGATAAQGLFGKAMTIGKHRGQLLAAAGTQALITIHPSYLLRIEDAGQAAAEYDRFVADLRLALPFV